MTAKGRFEEWIYQRVVKDPKILAGEPTFRGSRLGVRQVGEEAISALRDDYPYLTDDDIRFAPIYLEKYP